MMFYLQLVCSALTGPGGRSARQYNQGDAKATDAQAVEADTGEAPGYTMYTM